MSSADRLSQSLLDMPPERLALIRFIADEAAARHMPAYIVGGFVRDLLLNRPGLDFDIVVEGDAIKLGKTLVKKFGGKLTRHIKFGTATWQTPESFQSSNPEYLDLITARSETYTQPGALPTVIPATIKDDLRRRDFTINAMALRMDGDHFGELLDPLSGQKDLDGRLIRVLHDRSFVDDPTRILRAVRYAERYGFQIAPDTLRLANDEARTVLSQLSGERLRHEFDLIFEETNPFAMLVRVAKLDLLKAIHPALKQHAGFGDILTMPDFSESKTDDLLSVRQMLGWNLWLMKLPAEDITSLAVRLTFPAALTKSVLAAAHLLSALPAFADAHPSQWAERLDNIPPLAVFAVYHRTSQSALKDYLEKWRHIKARTTGSDLKVRGILPGPQYKKILQKLRAAWLDGEVRTGKEEENLLLQLLDKLN
jgi:tRNA nucleotidyltransferase (CCA-adding enzyme)